MYTPNLVTYICDMSSGDFLLLDAIHFQNSIYIFCQPTLLPVFKLSRLKLSLKPVEEDIYGDSQYNVWHSIQLWAIIRDQTDSRGDALV